MIPTIKKQSVSHIIKLQEAFDLCDIWRIRNPKKKSFIFRQKHFSGIIQHRLDYLLISDSLQEIASSVDILNAFSTDDSSVFCSLIKYLKFAKDPGFWKFNNSLICNSDFVDEIKICIHNTKVFLKQIDTLTNQSK